MILADWIAIVIILGSMGIGIGVGFGSGLRFFTKGIFGFIIGIAVCALFGTVFLNVGFIGDLLNKLAACWEGNEFLTKMHLEIIIYYIVLFVVVQILRVILVTIITKLLEANTFVTRFINKTLGAILFLALGILITLLVLKVIGWVGGDVAGNLYEHLMGSLFNLDGLFDKINTDWNVAPVG